MSGIDTFLKKKLVISSSEAIRFLGNRMALSRMAEKGEIVPLGAGYYSDLEIETIRAQLLVVARYYPQCVISNKTALTLYGLGQDPINEIDVDIPKDTYLKNSLLNVHRVSERKIEGVVKKQFFGVKVQIYSPERCLYEAYKLGRSSERFYRAIKRYHSRFKVDYGEVERFDEMFNTNILAHLTQEDVDE